MYIYGFLYNVMYILYNESNFSPNLNRDVFCKERENQAKKV